MGQFNVIKTFILKAMPEPFLFYLKRIHYVRMLRALTEDREPDIKVVKNLVNPGDHVFDIGANVGFYTLFLSRFVGQNGSVNSFEPIPMTFNVLSHIKKKLELSNVEVYNYGISDKAGSMVMEIPKYDSGSENFYQSRLIEKTKIDNSLREFQVELTTIDSFCLNISSKISFMKIDVEGHELQVINGAIKLINTFHPALHIEISGNPDDNSSNANKLFNQLLSSGYLPYWFDGKKLKLRIKGDKSINYFFLTEDQLNCIDQRMF